MLLQDDVIDLNNKGSAAYSDMVAEDRMLAAFLSDLTKEIEKNVGETLARAEGTEQTDRGEGDAQETGTPDVSGSPTSKTVVTEVKTTGVINIRTSDSETAVTSGTVTVKENVRIRSGASETSDKLTTAYAGEKLEVIIKQADGWTKIKYQGKTAYVKSDYVE